MLTLGISVTAFSLQFVMVLHSLVSIHTQTYYVCTILFAGKQTSVCIRVCCSQELWKYFMFLWFLSSPFYLLLFIFSLSLTLSFSRYLFLFIHRLVSLKFRYFMFSIDTCLNVDTIYVDRLAVTEFNIHYFRRHFSDKWFIHKRI